MLPREQAQLLLTLRRVLCPDSELMRMMLAQGKILRRHHEVEVLI
jgi:hypothetical protein